MTNAVLETGVAATLPSLVRHATSFCFCEGAHDLKNRSALTL